MPAGRETSCSLNDFVAAAAAGAGGEGLGVLGVLGPVAGDEEPPQGRQEASLPSAEGCRGVDVAKADVSEKEEAEDDVEGGPPADVIRGRGTGRPRPRLSRSTALPLLPFSVVTEMLGRAVTVTALSPVPAAVALMCRSVSWLGRACRVWISRPPDRDIMDSCEVLRRRLRRRAATGVAPMADKVSSPASSALAGEWPRC